MTTRNKPASARGAAKPDRAHPGAPVHIDVPPAPPKPKPDAITARCIRSLREMADQLEASFATDPRPQGVTGLTDFQERFLATDKGMERVATVSLTYFGNVKFAE